VNKFAIICSSMQFINNLLDVVRKINNDQWIPLFLELED